MARVDTKDNSWSFDQIYDEYKTPIYNYVYHLVGDREQADDLTQDTFHQALKTIDAARAKSGMQFHAKAWLLQIALNTVRMQRRRRSIFRSRRMLLGLHRQ